MIRSLDENDVINIAIGDAIKAVWTDPGKSVPLLRQKNILELKSSR